MIRGFTDRIPRPYVFGLALVAGTVVIATEVEIRDWARVDWFFRVNGVGGGGIQQLQIAYLVSNGFLASVNVRRFTGAGTEGELEGYLAEIDLISLPSEQVRTDVVPTVGLTMQLLLTLTGSPIVLDVFYIRRPFANSMSWQG